MSRMTKIKKVNNAAIILTVCLCAILIVLHPLCIYGLIQCFPSNDYTPSDYGGNNIPDKLPSADGSSLPNTPTREKNPNLFVDISTLPKADFIFSQRDLTNETPLTAGQIFEKVDPSVVVVVAENSKGASVGTGVVMSSDGYIITNEHVVSPGEIIYIIAYDNIAYDAKIVDLDATSDLALLKVDAFGLIPAEFADSSNVKIGDIVAAIGTPYSIEYAHTLSDGIISGIRSDVYVNNRKLQLLQSNVAVNPGNSGGPLINEYGQVIGIVRSKIMTDGEDVYEGMSFSIPTSHVNIIVNGFLHGEKPIGKPLLGLSVVYLDEEAAKENNMVSGAYVLTIDTNCDAYTKGIRAGDVILTINDKSFDSTDGFVNEKNKYNAGDAVDIFYWHEGVTNTVSVILMEDMT